MKKHGDTDRMVSRKIQDLSNEDLEYLEKILQEKYTQELERDSNWLAKNHYKRPGEKKAKIYRILDAVRSQKRLTTIEKW